MLTGLGFKIKDKDRQLTSVMLYQLSLLCHGRPGSLPPGVKAPVLPATQAFIMLRSVPSVLNFAESFCQKWMLDFVEYIFCIY